jgi:hypothetical protein
MLPIALLLFGHLAWSAPRPAPSDSPTVAEQYLFQAANAERVQRGMRALRWDNELFRAANGHAREMAARASISHQYPGEPDLSTRGRDAGAKFNVISENVAEAPNAVRIHEAWMQSAGHRANLLDPRVDSVGIGVISRNGELYAVEDFDRSYVSLSLQQQEDIVADLVQSTSSVEVLPSSDTARRTCAMQTGYAGNRVPWFVMRYTAAELTTLPDALKDKLASGRFRQAQVGACSATGTNNFSAYSIAVMLFP